MLIFFVNWVARVVARHQAERLAKEMWVLTLNDYFGEAFTNNIGKKIISWIQQLPYNKRYDLPSICTCILLSKGICNICLFLCQKICTNDMICINMQRATITDPLLN